MMPRCLLVSLVVLALPACGGPHVTVEAEVDGRAIDGLPVWLLPYDRVALLDSLAADADEPEPGVPPEWVARMEALGDTLAAAQALDPDERARVEAQRAALQAGIDSVRAAHRAWEQETYAGFEDAVQARVRDAALSEKVDTTNAGGRARLGADEGRWWVWARYVLPASTLEWNEPVVLRGDSAVVRLTRENARERPFF
jgi:hypothetical protein